MSMFRQISYTIYSSHGTCGFRHAIEREDVLEFSIKLLSNPSEWIPLSFSFVRETTTSTCRRGYCVQDLDILDTTPGNASYKPYSRRNIQICGFPLNDSVQLRWLMSSTVVTRNSPYEDRWSLDDIQVFLMTHNHSKILMVESFNEPSLK